MIEPDKIEQSIFLLINTQSIPSKNIRVLCQTLSKNRSAKKIETALRCIGKGRLQGLARAVLSLCLSRNSLLIVVDCKSDQFNRKSSQDAVMLLSHTKY